MSYWMIEYKCTAEATSSIRHDDAEFYLNQAIVPADNEEHAVELLNDNLSKDKITIEEIRKISLYDDLDLSNDVFEIKEAYEDAVQEKCVVTALFIPSDALEYMDIK